MKIDTQKNLKDIVFYMKDNKIICSEITGIMIERHIEVTLNKTFFWVKHEGNRIEQSFLFCTKQELINSL